VNVTVTSDTRVVMGVTTSSCTTCHRQGQEDPEDTYDWYAQDKDGNVWYFGEDTTAYEDGKADTEGSWEGGVDGAQPGIIMEADPQVGDSYRQEYLRGRRRGLGGGHSIDKTVTIGMGTYKHCIETSETTALEPDLVEVKDYAIGPRRDQGGGRDGRRRRSLGADRGEEVAISTASRERHACGAPPRRVL
jgi:hypothetical protein